MSGQRPRLKRPSEIQTHSLIWKQVRKTDEIKYDFSSPALKKKNTSGSTIKCAPVSELEPSRQGVTHSACGGLTRVSVLDQLSPPILPTPTSPYAMVNPPSPYSGITDTSQNEMGYQLSVLEAYVHELKQHAAMAPCDQTLRNFVLQDAVFESGFLKPNSFVFVSRCAKSFKGSIKMVFWCSCDSQRAQLVDCLPSVNSECFETLEQHFPPCMHIIAAKIVLEQVDCINDISPSIDFADHTYASLDLYGEWEITGQVISFKHGAASCVCVEGSSGVVCYDKKSIFCATCQYGASSCRHVTHVLQLIQEQPPPSALKHWVLPTAQSTASSSYISCKSTTLIPFQYEVSRQDILKKPMNARFNVGGGMAYLYPQSQASCAICGAKSWSDPIILRESVIITETVTFPAKVFCRKCTTKECPGEVQYDAHQSCLLDMGSFLAVYEMLRRLFYHYAVGRGTIYTEYTILKKMHADAGNITLPTLLSYNHFRMAWYSYLGLLDINYTEGFTCSHCGTTPDVLLMDATTLAFRRELDSKNLFLPEKNTLTLRAGR